MVDGIPFELDCLNGGIGMWKKISTIGGAILVLFGLIAAVTGYAGNYAKVETVEEVKVEVATVAKDVEGHKIRHRMNYLEERMWKITEKWLPIFKEEYNRPPATTEELLNYMIKDDREMYLKLQKEFIELEKELEKKEDDNE